MYVVPGGDGLDLSTVTAAVFHVERSDGTTTTWTAARSNQTATTLTLTHTLANGDLTVPGKYNVKAYLTIPSGTKLSEVDEFVVRNKFAVRD